MAMLEIKNIKTVGELIKALQKVNPDMPIRAPYYDMGYQVPLTMCLQTEWYGADWVDQHELVTVLYPEGIE